MVKWLERSRVSNPEMCKLWGFSNDCKLCGYLELTVHVFGKFFAQLVLLGQGRKAETRRLNR